MLQWALVCPGEPNVVSNTLRPVPKVVEKERWTYSDHVAGEQAQIYISRRTGPMLQIPL